MDNLQEKEWNAAWIPASERKPDNKPGRIPKEYIVAVQRKDGKTYVFAAYYLNEYRLLTDDDDCPEDGVPTSGWFIEMADDWEYDTAWHSILNEGDRVTHWMPLPPAPTQNTEVTGRHDGR